MSGLDEKILKDCPGSPPGVLSRREKIAAFVRFWAWHLGAALLMAVELAASYLHQNIGLIEAKYGFALASVAFGLTGVFKGYREMLKQRAEDTRKQEG